MGVLDGASQIMSQTSPVLMNFIIRVIIFYMEKSQISRVLSANDMVYVGWWLTDLIDDKKSDLCLYNLILPMIIDTLALCILYPCRSCSSPALRLFFGNSGQIRQQRVLFLWVQQAWIVSQLPLVSITPQRYDVPRINYKFQAI